MSSFRGGYRIELVLSLAVGYTGDGPAVYRCESNEEILAVLDRLLSTPLRSTQPDVLDMDWTVREFERLYFED
jgi:hypothetical protein